MAIKTFTTGEVLTAADTNTYLANSGLVYIKSQTIGSAVATVNVTSAFSSTYDNYKIVIAGGTSTSTNTLTLKFGATVTGYNYSLVYATYATNAVSGACAANAAAILYVGSGVTSSTLGVIEIGSPNIASTTQVSAPFFDATNAGHLSAYVNNTTQYTDFTVGITVGTMTGGTITVYGYRKA